MCGREPLKQGLFHSDPSHHQTRNRASLDGEIESLKTLAMDKVQKGLPKLGK